MATRSQPESFLVNKQHLKIMVIRQKGAADVASSVKMKTVVRRAEVREAYAS
jgi:hypothetical protein